MSFFDDLKNRESELKTLNDLKAEEKSLYNERKILFQKINDLTFYLRNSLKVQAINEFKEYFLNHDNFTLTSSNEHTITIESLTVRVKLEILEEFSLQFSLVSKDSTDYSRNKFYVIAIDESESTVYCCKYLGSEYEGRFIYPGNQNSDTIEAAQEQIEKLKIDIQHLSAFNPNESEMVFKLLDTKYSYLGKEFKTVTNLLDEIMN